VLASIAAHTVQLFQLVDVSSKSVYSAQRHDDIVFASNMLIASRILREGASVQYDY
jgi:hypothetical protein